MKLIKYLIFYCLNEQKDESLRAILLLVTVTVSLQSTTRLNPVFLIPIFQLKKKKKSV